MNEDDFKIKHATIKDVPLILSFIQQLAEYQGLSHKVMTTEKDLKENLFGKKAYAEVIIGYLNKQPVSFAIFFHNFSSFSGRPGIYLEDLYVNPNVRGFGIGQQMLMYLAQIAKERNCARLEWWVLDWNESAIAFYKKSGAKPLKESTIYCVSGEALDNLAQVKDEVDL